MRRKAGIVILGKVLLIAAVACAASGGVTAFNDYINGRSPNQQSYERTPGTVLVLGVGAGESRADEIRESPTASKDPISRQPYTDIIPVSTGNGFVDALGATADRIGIHLGRLSRLKGKHVERIVAHSWGSDEVLNGLEAGDFRCDDLVLFGSPSTPVDTGRLEKLIRSGAVRKITAYVNRDDKITWFRWLPHLMKTKSGAGWGYTFTFGGAKEQTGSIEVIPCDLKGDEEGHGYEEYHANVAYRNAGPFRHIPVADYGSAAKRGRVDASSKPDNKHSVPDWDSTKTGLTQTADTIVEALRSAREDQVVLFGDADDMGELAGLLSARGIRATIVPAERPRTKVSIVAAGMGKGGRRHFVVERYAYRAVGRKEVRGKRKNRDEEHHDDDDWPPPGERRANGDDFPPPPPPPPPPPFPVPVLVPATRKASKPKPPPPPPGGILIDPHPSKAGHSGDGDRTRVLESRPSSDSLSWDADDRKDESR